MYKNEICIFLRQKNKVSDENIDNLLTINVMLFLVLLHFGMSRAWPLCLELLIFHCNANVSLRLSGIYICWYKWEQTYLFWG